MSIEDSSVSVKNYVLSLIAVAGFAITGTGIYFNVLMSNEKTDYVNARLDKKTARIEAYMAKEFKDVEDRLDKLEEKESDNN